MTDFVPAYKALPEGIHLRVNPDLAGPEVDHALKAVPDSIDEIAESLPQLALLIWAKRHLASGDQLRDFHDLVDRRGNQVERVGAPEEREYIRPDALDVIV